MKKNILLLSIVTLTSISVADLRAEESPMPPPENEFNMQDAGMGQRPDAEQGPRGMKGGMMKGGMMQHNKPSMVATNDGGVIVLDGPRLLKYDAQLNLVGEAELKPGKKPSQPKKEEAPAIELPAVETSAPVAAEPVQEVVEALPTPDTAGQ